MDRTRFYPRAALCCALALTGCANPMSQRSEHEARTERTLVDQHLQVDLGAPAQLEQSRRRIKITEQRTFAVTDYEVTRRYDRYTPYQPWRKLYEIPAGAVALIGGVGANIANVFALGHLPSSMTHDWLRYGVDGLNPFMNMASNGRAEQNLAGVDEVQTATRQDVTREPWADQPVGINTGRQVFSLPTDSKGYLQLNLLEAPFSERTLRGVSRLGLSVSDHDQQLHADAWLPLAPGLQARLEEARPLVFDDLEDGDVGQWVQRVKRLSQLGLPEEADELQQSLVELTRNDPELQQDFVRALQRQTGRTARID